MKPASGIRERIAAMEVVACRLAHERACWDKGRVIRCQVGDQDVLVRHLCGSDVRRQRLACAHTTARNVTEHALLELRDAGVLGEEACAAFVQELRTLGDQIHLLDHRKGDADKVYALAAEAARLTTDAAAHASRDEAKALLRTMELEHDGYVERLRDWRDRVLAAADGQGG